MVLGKVFKGLGKITKGVGAPIIGIGVGFATMNPAAGFAAYSAASGINKYNAGRRLKKFGREYEEQQIALANEYAEGQRLIGQQRLDAANHAAHLMGRQASMLRAAAAQAREIAAKNASLVMQEGQEVLRRTKAEHKQTEQRTEAGLWSTGFLASRGSMGEFQSELRAENKRQQSWIKKSFAQQAQVVREGGDIEAAMLTAQAAGVSAGAHQIAAEGIAAFQQAELNAQQAIAQAQLSGDAYIRQGKSAMSSGIGQFALGVAGLGIGLGGFGGGVSSGGGGAGGGFRGIPRAPGSFGASRWGPSPSGNRGAI